MNPQELRIGNIIDAGGIVRVEALTSNSITFKGPDIHGYEMVAPGLPTDIEGVPITGKRMQALGFDKSKALKETDSTNLHEYTKEIDDIFACLSFEEMPGDDRLRVL